MGDHSQNWGAGSEAVGSVGLQPTPGRLPGAPLYFHRTQTEAKLSFPVNDFAA